MACEDNYDAWLELNAELERLRDRQAELEESWNENFYDAFDFLHKPGSFFRSLSKSGKAFDEMVEIQWEADRLENGAWGKAADDLWACIESHD